MGLTFIIGVVIYLLILVTLMVWFLKYHWIHESAKPEFPLSETQLNHQNPAEKSVEPPNHVSKNLR